MAESTAPQFNAEDFAAANKAYFDEQAYKDHGHGQELGRRNVAAMCKAWPELFDEDETVAMDYACGTGLVSSFESWVQLSS